MTKPNDEQWHPVVGWEGLYEVSSLGRVKSLERVATRRRSGPLRIKERIIRTYPAKRGGYPTLQLHKDGKRTLRQVHSIVAAAFIGPRPPGLDVCHRDGDVTNNAASNLRYDTRTGNMADTIANGRIAKGEKHGVSKITRNAAWEIRRRFREGAKQADLAREYQLAPTTVHSIVRNRTWL